MGEQRYGEEEERGSGAEFAIWAIVMVVASVATSVIWLAMGFNLAVFVLGIVALVGFLKTIFALGDVFDKVGS